MLDNVVNDVRLIQTTLLYYLPLTLGILTLLFVIHFLNKLSGQKLSIICSPFLHGNFNHLFFNAIPLFFLMNMVLVSGYNVFITVSLVIILLSGSLIWLFGRFSIHLGSSSVIMGYFGFLSIYAYMNPNFLSLLLMILCLYYFGGLVAALVPTNAKGISVEGHIFGYLSGMVAYFCWPMILTFI
jgi:membrane associated rhomboid family serine protease